MADINADTGAVVKVCSINGPVGHFRQIGSWHRSVVVGSIVSPNEERRERAGIPRSVVLRDGDLYLIQVYAGAIGPLVIVDVHAGPIDNRALRPHVHDENRVGLQAYAGMPAINSAQGRLGIPDADCLRHAHGIAGARRCGLGSHGPLPGAQCCTESNQHEGDSHALHSASHPRSLAVTATACRQSLRLPSPVRVHPQLA
jgi:hypothetical protein